MRVGKQRHDADRAFGGRAARLKETREEVRLERSAFCTSHRLI